MLDKNFYCDSDRDIQKWKCAPCLSLYYQKLSSMSIDHRHRSCRVREAKTGRDTSSLTPYWPSDARR